MDNGKLPSGFGVALIGDTAAMRAGLPVRIGTSGVSVIARGFTSADLDRPLGYKAHHTDRDAALDAVRRWQSDYGVRGIMVHIYPNDAIVHPETLALTDRHGEVAR